MTISVSPQNNLTLKYSCLKCFMIWLVRKENKSSLRFETATFFIPVAWYYPCRENKSACLFTIFTLAHSLLEYIYIFIPQRDTKNVLTVGTLHCCCLKDTLKATEYFAVESSHFSFSPYFEVCERRYYPSKLVRRVTRRYRTYVTHTKNKYETKNSYNKPTHISKRVTDI